MHARGPILQGPESTLWVLKVFLENLGPLYRSPNENLSSSEKSGPVVADHTLKNPGYAQLCASERTCACLFQVC